MKLVVIIGIASCRLPRFIYPCDIRIRKSPRRVGSNLKSGHIETARRAELIVKGQFFIILLPNLAKYRKLYGKNSVYC